MVLIFYALAAPPLGIEEEGKNQCLMAATKGGGGESPTEHRHTKNASLRNKRSRDFYAAQYSFFFSRDSPSGKGAFLARCLKLLLRHFFLLTLDRCFFASSIKKCRLSEDCAELRC